MSGITNSTNRSAEQPLLSDQNLVKPEKTKEGFRIKKAAKAAFIVLAATFATIAVVTATAAIITGFVVSSVIPAVICATVATVALVALATLGLIKAWEKITPHLPKFLRIPANYIQSVICGLASAAGLGAIWLIDYTKKNVKPEDVNPNQPLVIGVHGFLGGGNNWMYMFSRLREAGHENLATINLGNAFVSIDDYADKLHQLVGKYESNQVLKDKLNGKPLEIQFVCHSMGGLVARHYKQKYPDDNVNIKNIVTLGTPLNGTKVSKLALGVSKAAKEMNLNSEFVKNQQKNAALDNHTHYFHIASKCDYVIRPLVSAVQGNAPHTEKEWLDGTGHVSYMFSDKTADLVVDYFKREKLNSVEQAV